MNLSDHDDDDLVTTKELSEILKVSVSKLNKARMEAGKGPKFVKFDSSVRYRIGTVKEWIREKEMSHTRTSFAFGDFDLLDDHTLPPSDIIEEWLE